MLQISSQAAYHHTFSTEMTEIVVRKKELSLHLSEHEIEQFKKLSMANHVTVISNSGNIAKATDGIERIKFNREF
ncbi:hypothetical protein N9854_04100 [Amylibacter sp.]|nr:hypothetical protein [Amylibacter sp.]